MSSPEPLRRTLGTSARVMLVLTVVLGVLYPLLITVIAQVAHRDVANGSMVRDQSGNVVGSRLIGQQFLDAAGEPLPEYFQPRPSAAGDGYDATASSGSNQGPESPDLEDSVIQRREQIAEFNSVAESEVPPDALTASGSGLDPHISPAYAAIQIERVARTRGVDAAVVRRLVARHTESRDLGFLGSPRVNVLELNLALDRLP